MSMEKGRSKAKKCIRILEEHYGIPEAREIDPVDLLVATILSQNTTDKNSLRAFGMLKSSYPDYDALLCTPVSEIEETIRVGGLSEMKARRIKESLANIKAHVGSISLSFLKDVNPREAQEYLQSLPGVGPKTAAVVLLFAFGVPIMPVDTHVFRVSKRLGLVPEDASIQAVQCGLEKITPPSKYMSLHINLIRQGRRICKARNPMHSNCALRELCDYNLHGHKT